MSWSVSATGTPGEIKETLDKQFEGPLADAPRGLSDEGEKTTVRHIQGTIRQCLETFDPNVKVSVSAYGHMGFGNWETKAGANQTVNLTISPTA